MNEYSLLDSRIWLRRDLAILKPQRSQSPTIPATAYEPAPSSQRGTRMTRIARNLHANCMQIAHKNYDMPLIVRGYRETEPQMNAQSSASGGRIHVCLRAYVSMRCGGHNADERRFVNLDIHRKTQEALAR